VAGAVDTEGLRTLIDAGAQLVEVLPRTEYDDERLPGAVHLPLTELDAESARVLDPTRPIAVYCYDYQ
jgi:rhodanese-related sulfurtransferase